MDAERPSAKNFKKKKEQSIPPKGAFALSAIIIRTLRRCCQDTWGPGIPTDGKFVGPPKIVPPSPGALAKSTKMEECVDSSDKADCAPAIKQRYFGPPSHSALFDTRNETYPTQWRGHFFWQKNMTDTSAVMKIVSTPSCRTAIAPQAPDARSPDHAGRKGPLPAGCSGTALPGKSSIGSSYPMT